VNDREKRNPEPNGAPRLRFSPRRMWLITQHTFLAAVRQRIFGFLLTLALALTAGSLGLRELNFGASELKFLTDLGLGALVFFGSILTIVVTAQLFCGEIEHRTALTLLAKPVRRSEFVGGKFLGAWLVVAVFCGLVIGLLELLLALREQGVQGADLELAAGPTLVRYGDLAWIGLLHWVKFGVLAAMTLLVASVATSNLSAVTLSFLALVICHLQYLARDAWQGAGSLAARVGGALLGLLFPNFQLFNAGEFLAANQPLDGAFVGRTALYGLAYVAVFLGLAIAAFRRREI
jgi:ABC-type transport system involved in multi-copper enzyme maturation permease subunit